MLEGVGQSDLLEGAGAISKFTKPETVAVDYW